MQLVIASSAVLIILCISLHFHQHFRLNLCCARKSSKQQTSISCCYRFRDDAEFDFFPVSFLFYMILITIGTVLIMLKFTYEDTDNIQLLFNDSVFQNRLIDITSLDISSRLDYAIYCIIIVAIAWESLFSFYRYFTTKRSIQYFRFQPTDFKSVLRSFSIYCIIFIALFTIQTQIYFYLFPIVILYHFVINIFWIMKTSQLIIYSLKCFSVQNRSNSAPTRNYTHEAEQSDLIHCVVIMRYLSVTCSISSTLCLAAFTVFYDMKVVYYLPVLWCFYILCFSFNFIRNRQAIKHIFCDKTRLQSSNSSSISRTPKQQSVHVDIGASEITEKQHTDHKFVVCVERIEIKDSKPINGPPKGEYPVISPHFLAAPCDKLTTPIVVPPNAENHAKQAGFIAYRSHSCGDLLSLVHTQKLPLNAFNTLPLKLRHTSSNPLSSSAVHHTPTVDVSHISHFDERDDGTFFCAGYDDLVAGSKHPKVEAMTTPASRVSHLSLKRNASKTSSGYTNSVEQATPHHHLWMDTKSSEVSQGYDFSTIGVTPTPLAFVSDGSNHLSVKKTTLFDTHSAPLRKLHEDQMNDNRTHSGNMHLRNAGPEPSMSNIFQLCVAQGFCGSAASIQMSAL